MLGLKLNYVSKDGSMSRMNPINIEVISGSVGILFAL